MQVETSAVAGIAYIPYNLPCRYCFPCGNGSLRHVGVPRGQARTVVQQNLVAVAVVLAGDNGRAAVGSEDVPSGVGIYSRSSSSHIRYIRFWVLPFFCMPLFSERGNSWSAIFERLSTM